MTRQSREGPTPPHYDTILQNIRDGIYTLDTEGQITWVNETALLDFDLGYSRDELIGSPVSMVLADEDIRKCTEIISDCLQNDNRNSGRCEVTIHCANEREIPCDLHLTVLQSRAGEFQGTVGVIRDISDRQRREQILEVVNRVLRHNLRNDMNVILGRAELLEEVVDGEQLDHVRSIQDIGHKLIELTEKIRWATELDDLSSGYPTRIDVADQLHGIIEAVGESYPEAHFDVIDQDAGGRMLSLPNEAIFRFILTELLENAIIHNDTGQPTIEVALDKRDGGLEIRVQDNGPGLPAIEREVLERGTETPLEHGSGVGLWLVYWSLTAIGGTIRFDEPAGRGTAISLHFPRRQTSDHAD